MMSVALFTITALAMFYYSGFTSQTDYFHFAVARTYQSFSYAFMFVPVTQLAYSYLPKNKNNKGLSLMNLCRNWAQASGSHSSPRCSKGAHNIVRACS